MSDFGGDSPAPYDLNFPRAHGEVLGCAQFRTHFEDFRVIESLGFEPEGEGEHTFLFITKTDTNTAWVVKELAKFAGVKPSDIGYSGLKDRRAVTSQWFSIYLPKDRGIDWLAFNTEHWQVEQCTKAQKKLRRGQHHSNAFNIVLRNFKVSAEALTQRLDAIKLIGVPNYFGEQRFGREGGNLSWAKRWLEEGETIRSRDKKKMTMSAARSYLFNRVLAERVKRGNWNMNLEGEAQISEPALSGFPTAPMWGRGHSSAKGEALELENQALNGFEKWRDGLEHCGLSQERRVCVSHPMDLNFDYDEVEGLLELRFSLLPGQYATALLRELASLQTDER